MIHNFVEKLERLTLLELHVGRPRTESTTWSMGTAACESEETAPQMRVTIRVGLALELRGHHRSGRTLDAVTLANSVGGASNRKFQSLIWRLC